MIKEAIGNLVSGKSLTMQEASSVMEEIMDGTATQAQMGAFMVALRLKGETPEEVAGFASVMRSRSRRVSISGPVIDIVGTGGDNQNTFNISTTAAFVMAGAGLVVAKHGNRAMSSRCGSADVLEALGVRIDLTPEQVKACLEKTGIGFMFAQAFHPAMKFAATPRKEIGIRTIFNILGPLTNPAGAQYQVIGVPSEQIGDKISQALIHLHTGRTLVVHGLSGVDELSISGKSVIWDVDGTAASVTRKHISPEELGLNSAPIESIKGGTPQENAAILHSILGGEKTARRDVVLLNAAAGIYVAGKAASLKEAIEMAKHSIDKRLASQKLNLLVDFSSRLA